MRERGWNARDQCHETNARGQAHTEQSCYERAVRSGVVRNARESGL